MHYTMASYEQIFENNRLWAEEKRRSDGQFFRKLAEGQDPDFLYIGCSDSRVTAEDMMGAEPGEVFVHRNIANMVNEADPSSSSVVYYAVTVLKVKHIVICGHYNCGGVLVAMDIPDAGPIEPWVKNIRLVQEKHAGELAGCTDRESSYKKLVELNTIEQCRNVAAMEVVRKSYIENGYPEVHGWIFDISTGRLIDLDLSPHEEEDEAHL